MRNDKILKDLIKQDKYVRNLLEKNLFEQRKSSTQRARQS